jgi:hypothetical protein
VDQHWHSRIDHLVLAAPSLVAGILHVEEHLGVSTTYGGRHPGMGTQNALVRIGHKTYIEIIAPDPKQNRVGPLWFGVEKVESPRWVNWAIRISDMDDAIHKLAVLGFYPGPLQSGSRITKDGTILSWQLTDPRPLLMDGIIPFFIDWGDSPHPADQMEQQVSLIDLSAIHPHPNKVKEVLAQIDVDMVVNYGEEALLKARFSTRSGEVEM